MTPKLRLFTSPSAFPNPQRLRLFMHEKRIADQFEERIYDMTPGGEQRQWPHLKMNPWGETPTLQLTDGSVLAETDAIVRYLDQSYPGRKIMGETPLQQGVDTMWNNRIWVNIHYRITTAFHVLHQGLGPKLELTTNHAWGEKRRKATISSFRWFEMMRFRVGFGWMQRMAHWQA
jgi:glutathione S-transferase